MTRSKSTILTAMSCYSLVPTELHVKQSLRSHDHRRRTSFLKKPHDSRRYFA
jgi:hypothetical protein